MRSLLEERGRLPSEVLVASRIADLFVASEGEHTRPVELIDHLVDLDAHLGVLAHPVDLLSDRRKAVRAGAGRVELEDERHDVRLVAARASEAAVRRASQHRPALVGRQFMDQHRDG